MKHICTITTSLEEEKALRPLMDELTSDPNLTHTHLSACAFKSPELIIQYRHVEEQGACLDQAVDIRLDPGPATAAGSEFDPAEITRQLKDIHPELLVVAGESYETFSAAAAAALTLDIPVAHIGGGETRFDPNGPSYGYGITKVAHLHFTASDTFRKRVIGFGEHPDRVFNVGALSIEGLRRATPMSREAFARKMDLNPDDRFLLVSLAPDRALGSGNRAMADNLLAALDRDALKDFKLICHLPKDKGLGKIIRNQMKAFAAANPDRVRFLESLTSNLGLNAMGLCSAIVGNSPQAVVEGASLRVPAVNIGDIQKDNERTANVIDAGPDTQSIRQGIEAAVSPEFRISLYNTASPFEKRDTLSAIKQAIREFTRADMRAKAYYSE